MVEYLLFCTPQNNVSNQLLKNVLLNNIFIRFSSTGKQRHSDNHFCSYYGKSGGIPSSTVHTCARAWVNDEKKTYLRSDKLLGLCSQHSCFLPQEDICLVEENKAYIIFLNTDFQRE